MLFSRRSCRVLNDAGPFGREAGALTTELSPPPPLIVNNDKRPLLWGSVMHQNPSNLVAVQNLYLHSR